MALISGPLSEQVLSPLVWTVIPTDASLSGLGSVLVLRSTQGCWILKEFRLPIHGLGTLSDQSLPGTLDISSPGARTVLIQSDNTTVKAYANHQGATKSLLVALEVSGIFWLAESHILVHSAVYIPGVDS